MKRKMTDPTTTDVSTQATNDSSPSTQSGFEKKGLFANFGGNLAGGVTVVTLIVGAYGLGHGAGVSDGSVQAQNQINDLRDKVASETTAATISKNNEISAQSQTKQWQDAYNKLVESNRNLTSQNDELKGQISQLDPCAYMEHELDAVLASINAGWRSEDILKRRDGIQEQLSTCKH